jgi:hypothetical protein
MDERIFAAIDGETIVNTFVGDDDFADLVRGEYDEVIEITDLTPRPGVRWTVHQDGYRPPAPYSSWGWNGTAWEAPIPMPTEGGPWQWNESAGNWEENIVPSEQ